MKTLQKLLLSLFVLAISAGNALAGSASDKLIAMDKNPAGFARISAAQLVPIMDIKDFNLINVHVPYNGEIPRTDANIDFRDLQTFVRKNPNKNKPVVIYCRSGSMSGQMAMTLARSGYTNVVELSGGYNAWKSIGMQLEFK